MQRLIMGVGLRQPNRSADVKLVQSLLNGHRPSSLARLVEDGLCGALTVSAIREFQSRVVGLRDPDGVVSPDGPTFGALSGGSAPQPSTTDPAIEALDLADMARRAAYDLKHRFPAISFTSGRRSLTDQARAMAGNVVLNRQWIVQTYVDSPASRACQKWVNEHPQATTKEAIAQGLLTVLQGLPASEAGRISKHLSGEAFDIQPVETDAEAIKAAARSLTGARFLEKEGGLVRWHVQF
jgi:hypothetical protein